MSDDELSRLLEKFYEEPESSDSERQGGLFASTLRDWVDQFLIPLYIPRGPVLWCPMWQTHHGQAAFAFEALWRSYEEARAADMASAGAQNTMNWYLGHFQPGVDLVTNPFGAFAQCDPDRCGTEHRFGSSSPFGG